MRTLKAKGRHLDAACLQVLTASIDHYETRCALELAQHYFSLFVQTQKNFTSQIFNYKTLAKGRKYLEFQNSDF
jgi:hypothetical protein